METARDFDVKEFSGVKITRRNVPLNGIIINNFLQPP